MLRIIDTAKVPPGGLFRYKDPETGISFSHPYFVQVKSMAHKHRSVNHLPIPVNWEIWIEDQICQATTTCPCEPLEGEGRSTWNKALTLAKAITEWTKAGFPLVSDEVLAERRGTCEGDDTHERCRYWQQSGKWGFGKCAKCGCIGSLKTMLGSESCPLGLWKR